MTETQTATIHHLPPLRRAIPTDAQRAGMQPLSDKLASMTDATLSFTLTLVIEEMRRRRGLPIAPQARQILAAAFNELSEEMRRAGLDQMIVDRAAEIGLERMNAGDLETIAAHIDGRDGLGGVA